MTNLNVEPLFVTLPLHQVSQLVDAPHLSKLIKHTHLALLGRVVNRDLDAAHSVANVQVAARLATLAIHRQGVPNCCLHDKAIEGSAKDAVIVQTVEQEGVSHGLLCAHAIYHTLVLVFVVCVDGVFAR